MLFTRRQDTVEQRQDAAGQYITTGMALVLFGGFALVFAAIMTFVLGLEMRFMDGTSMMITSAIMVALGAWLTQHGKSMAR
ncbi:MAG: hypothetical protein AAFS10_14815 [Myxococcota bacterium]